MDRLNTFTCKAGFAEVQTDKGTVRGYENNSVYHFLGIPYAKAERFQPPEPADPWEGVRTATDYGYVCTTPFLKFEPRNMLTGPFRMWPDSEHCQNLNIWTTATDPSAKKPVLVWIHGGAFSSGSAIHLDFYEGHNTALYGDAVCVSVNHRLGALGFMNLSAYGEEYKDSGNVGLLDLVAALRWVRDNIAAFGGDPDNVTIYGHSGGGGKISALMQMPLADGLYHKAIIQSGLIQNDHLLWPTQEDSLGWTEQLIRTAGSADRLKTMSAEELMDCCGKTFPNLMFWLPTQGAGSFLGDYGIVGLREETKDIPVLVGSALCEFGGVADFVDKSTLTEKEKLSELRKVYGDKAEEVKARFESAYPGVNSVYARNLDVSTFRFRTLDYLRKRREMNAPTYEYLLTYELEYAGGFMSYHGVELPFTFNNLDLCPAVFHGERTFTLRDELFGAWMSFAHTSNPNHDKLPANWIPHTQEGHYCMIFGMDAVCRADHDKELLDLFR